jgi:S1-C subfamily serine protease
MNAEHPETTPPSGPPKLRREAAYAVDDRGRLPLVIALCSLAGVGVGFGLASVAATQQARHCSTVTMQHRTIQAQPLGLAPSETAWLGVHITTGPRACDAATPRGARVLSVVPGSPAEAAGLRVGDVIERVDGAAVGGAESLVRLVRSRTPRSTVTVTLRRGGERMALTPRLGTMPPRFR